MSYDTFELSVAAGKPLELFLFERRGICWPYTSADEPITFQGITYYPQTLSRGAFERNDEAGSSEVPVQLDRTLKVCSQFVDGSTPYPVKLTIYRKHRNDNDFIVLFTGTVANAELKGEEISLKATSPLGSTEKPLPRHIILRTCPHVLYGPKCALNPEDWSDDQGTINSINGKIVQVTGLTDTAGGYYNAGVLIHVDTGKRAFIKNHSPSGANDNFTLLEVPVGWSTTDAVVVYAGCDRKHTTCRDKFDNIPNFGGFPLHPERNPIVDLQGN